MKIYYLCIDGPWKGVKLCLEEASTLPLTINGVAGRYAGGRGGLHWEPADEATN